MAQGKKIIEDLKLSKLGRRYNLHNQVQITKKPMSSA